MKRDTFERIIRALNGAGVPFIVVGGVAVVAHGYGRTTRDLDIVIRLQPDLIRAAFGALELLGYRPAVPVTAEAFADAEQRSRWIADKGMTVLNFFSDRHRGATVDVFTAEPFDFSSEYEGAMVQNIAPGVPVRIVRLSTLIRLKKQVGRLQDLADIEELRKIHGDRADA